MRSSAIILIILLQSCLIGIAQDVQIYQGYDKTMSGFNFNYHTPLKDYGTCLLSRAQADYQPIIWKTEEVPENYEEEYITFLWAYGMDVTPDSRNFDIYVNGEKYFTISNPVSNDLKEWIVKGQNGAMLKFNVTKIDKHKDQMGFVSLTLPFSSIIPGEAVTLKVDGEKAKSNSWYMTFTEKLEEEFSVAQRELVAKKSGSLFYVIGIDYINIGERSKGKIKINDSEQIVEVSPGSNSYEVLIPKTVSAKNVKIYFNIGPDKEFVRNIEIMPVKEWTVYMIQHSHTDIGYTRPQTEILPEHLRYIDYALDFCDQTDDYPENAKFRWTCEAAWPVREYLKSRPREQIDRLVERVREGRIEITAMYFNYGEIIDEASLAAQLLPLADFKKAGIEAKTLMQDDVNGIGWALVDYSQNTSLRFVLMGQHGHRARIPFKKPTAFWWESPSGNRLLAYRSEHYMHGNVLGLTAGDLDTFKNGLANYLSELGEKGYPFLHTAFQFSGYITDNSPPSTIACEVVKQWNENYEWPKVKLAVASEFLEYLEDNHADDLPSFRVAWPDWWADGFGSAMRETQAVRTTHEDLIANTGLLSMAKVMGAHLPEDINEDIREVQEALLFYDEHTFGAAESISDPYCENSMVQWAEKSSYAWNAVMKSRLLKEKAMGFVQPFLPKTDVPSLVVFNTLNWKRSGMVRVYIDHEIIPPGKDFKILDTDNNEIPAQAMESRNDGTYWGLWVNDIPAMGFKTFRIEPTDEDRALPEENFVFHHFSNKYYDINIDESNGDILGIYDKELKLELTDQYDTIKVGQFIYEQLLNRHQMERYTSGKKDTMYVPLVLSRHVPDHVHIISTKDGPIWKSLYLHAEMPVCTDEKGVNIELRLYHREKRIEIRYNMYKMPLTSPEGVYVAFPFHLHEGELVFEAQGGVVEPGVNQLEGTASDWNTIQNFAAVRNEQDQIVFESNDIPLVQFGDINLGRYYYKHKPEKTHIYSWVLNNYWTTNFKASQEGELEWSYNITSARDTSNSFATRFSWGTRVPFLTRVLPAGHFRNKLLDKSLIKLDIENLLLVSTRPSLDGKGIILQLRETDGKEASVNLEKLLYDKKPSSIMLVNVLEEKIRDLSGVLEIRPDEAVFLKIEL